jgi:hypothetical protein
MIPLWIAAEVTKALAEQGFVSGKYGDVPYTLVWPTDFSLHTQATTFSSAAVIIKVDDRQIGWIHVRRDGAKVWLDFAKWFKPDDFVEWEIRGWETVGMGIHNKAGIMDLKLKE